MTPEAWSAATTPQPLIAFVRGRVLASPGSAAGPVVLPPDLARRLLLFGCACARMVWDLLPTEARNAVQIRERFADGRATTSDLLASRVETTWGAVTPRQHAMNSLGTDYPDPYRSAAMAVACRAAGPAPQGRPTPDAWHDAWTRAFNEARATQADYVRDVFPPPGDVPRFHPDWLTSTVVALAREMDESGDFSAVPILADALQDAGCDDETLLAHCRAPGKPHVRGNWVVDLVVGR